MTDTETLPKAKTWKDTLWSATKLVLKIVVTTALLYYVFTKVPFNEVKYKLLHANYWWMTGAVIVFFISSIVSSWRLLSYFKSIGLNLDPKFNFRLYLLGMFYNFLLPGGIGGDGYKIYLLNKNYKLPAKKVFWAILFDRLSGLWAIGLIIVALVIFVPQVELHVAIPAAIFLTGTAVYYFVAHRFFKEYTNRFFEGHFRAILVQTLQVLTILMVLMGQGFNGKFAPYLLSFLLSALAAVVPISLGGAGAREAIFAQLSGPFHMNMALAIFLSISFYIISLIVSLFGVYYVLRPSRLQEGLPSIKETTTEEA